MSAGIKEDQESRGARSPSGPLDPEASQPSPPPCASPLRTPPAALAAEKPNPSPDPCSFLREIARVTALLKARPPPPQPLPRAARIVRISKAPGEGVRASDASAAGGVGRSPVSLGEARRTRGAPGLPEERARPRYRSYADCEERDSSPRCYRRRLRYRSIEECLNDPEFFVMKKKEITIGKEDNGKTKKKQGSHDVILDAAEIAEDEATATEDTANHLHDATGSNIPVIMCGIRHLHSVTFTKGFSVTHLKIGTWEELHLKAFGAYNQATPIEIKLLARSDMVGYLSAGWAHFARTNNINIGDVCAFQFDDKLSSVTVRVIREAAAAIKGIGMEAPGASGEPHSTSKDAAN